MTALTPFQLVFGPLCLLAAGVLLLRSVKGRFSLWKGGLWGLLWAMGGVIILRPDMTSAVAALLGIGRGTDLLTYVGILTGVYAVQRLYAHVRRLENVLTEVVRTQAIDKAHFGDIAPRRLSHVPR